MRLSCFSARRDGKTPPNLKFAIDGEIGQLLISASLRLKKRPGLLGLLFLPPIEQLFLGFAAVF
jgi:hypothetical protein